MPPIATKNIKQTFAWGVRTYVMAILNITPDSFSGDGLISRTISESDTITAAVSRAQFAIRDGADMLDIGGMSTRPGGVEVSEEEELARVSPLLRALSGNASIAIPLSIDTYRASVARIALVMGATIVNSVWGLRGIPCGDRPEWNNALADVVADSDALLILTHNGRTRVGKAGVPRAYDNLITEVRDDLIQQAEFAESRGIARDRLIVDPGLGFGKTPEQNLCLLRHLDELRIPGLPMLVGTSRKSFLGFAMGDIPPEERDPATAATTAWAIPRGADIVRVHDVRANVAAARMTDALFRVPPS